MKIGKDWHLEKSEFVNLDIEGKEKENAIITNYETGKEIKVKFNNKFSNVVECYFNLRS